MKQYKTIDLFKFICAILVIMLHASPFASYSKIITFIFRHIVTVIAVPFFFAASGFLVFSKLNKLSHKSDQKQYILKYVKRIFQMYLVWSAVYLVFVVYKWTINGFSYMNVLIYIRNFFFEGSYLTIWFLPALLSAVVFVYLLNKKFNKKTIILIAAPFYIFALLGSSYFGVSEKISILNDIFGIYYSCLQSVKNGLLFGFIFVALGAYISERQDNLKISSFKCLVGFLTSMVLLVIEVVAINIVNIDIRGCDILLSMIPTTIFMLLLALKWQPGGSDKMYLIFRKYGLLMFLVQRIPLSIIELFFDDTVLMTNSIVNFTMVLGGTMLLSFVIIKLSDKFESLKFLY